MHDGSQTNGNNFRGRYGFPGFALLIFAAAAVVMLLWNAILPDLLQVKRIGYWQSLGLLVLCRILFGSFHFGRRHHRAPFGSRGYMKQKWMQMSEEERIKFKEEWRARCGKRGE
jgi:hypothetical protein